MPADSRMRHGHEGRRGEPVPPDPSRSTREERFWEGQYRVLEALAGGRPLEEILTKLVKTIEAQGRDTLASLLLVDREKHCLRHAAAPSLPDAYNAAVDGVPIGARAGSCGTAAYRGETVVVEDIAKDPLWEEYRGLALQHGLRACWSQPVLSSHGEVLGTFAMYHHEPRRPGDHERRLIEAAARLAAIAIERKRAEETLEESEQRFAKAFRASPIPMSLSRAADGLVLDINESFLRATGYTRAELVGRSSVDIWVDPTARENMLGILRRRGSVRDLEASFRKKEGIFVASLSIEPLEISGGLLLLTAALDITERKQAEARRWEREQTRRRHARALVSLASSEELRNDDFEALLRRVTERAAETLAVDRVGVWVFDDGRSVLHCEDLFERRTRGHSAGTRLEASDYPHYFESLASGRSVAADDAHKDPRTSEFSEGYLTPLGITSMLDAPVRRGGELIGVVCHEHVGPRRTWTPEEQEFAASVGDLVALALEGTERRRAEQAFRRQQQDARKQVEAELERVKGELVRKTRLATVGEIAASIAHDIRNPLGVIRNAQYYLSRHLPEGEPKWAEYLGIIEHEIGVADRIVENLLGMARSRPPASKPVNLARAVRESFDGARAGRDVRIRLSLASDPYVVEADPGQLRQVLDNLMANAVQALEGSGEITVEARTEDGFHHIVVGDDGPGIPSELREQIFEPLFTTKAKGTGLGLSICRRFLDQHGGTIELADTGGRGAAFLLRLPIVPRDARSALEETSA